MEDLKREFEGEATKASPSHETRPPKRPDKLPLTKHQRAETPPMDQTKRPYNQVLSDSEARSSTIAFPNPDCADAAISDSNPRLAQFWAFPIPRVLSTMWQLWHPNPWVQNVHPAAQQAYQDALTQRSAQSRDDTDISRPQSSRERDEEQRVRREMDHLRMQLREANSRAEQAERAAEELAQQLTSRSNAMVVDSADSTETATTLEAENKELKAELDEARSHIFSLQPYRKDLTPKEVGQVSCDE
jgi:hypothetical protein